MRQAIIVLILGAAATGAQDRIARLSDMSATVRLEAAREFQGRHEATAAEAAALAELRHDRNSWVRSAAVLALARVGRADLALPHLDTFLLAEHPNPECQRDAWNALLAAGEEGRVRMRQLILDPESRSRTVASLAVLADDASTVRCALLRDPSWQLRRVVADLCAKCEDLSDGELVALAEALAHDPSSAVRLAAIRALAPLADRAPQARQALAQALGDEDARIRAAVVRALPAGSAQRAALALAALDDPHPAVVVYAALALCGSPLGGTARPALLACLEAECPEVRVAAACALAGDGMGGTRVTHLLLEPLGRAHLQPPWRERNLRAGEGWGAADLPVPDPATAAAWALVELGAGAVEPVLQHVRTSEGEERVTGVIVLAHVGEPARAALASLCDEPDPDVSATARRALQWLDRDRE